MMSASSYRAGALVLVVVSIMMIRAESPAFALICRINDRAPDCGRSESIKRHIKTDTAFFQQAFPAAADSAGSAAFSSW
jgi:hypothetical protein